MRNLKRVFALFLSLITALSLCVPALAASVEDYSDSETLAYVEQTDVLSALRIVEGDDTGSLNPKAPITRAEAATIVARLALTRQIADDMDATASRFSDMSKAPWAIKYVEACADLGIINGTGNGQFNPTGNVTGYEFAKMLLVTLGYGRNKEYIGKSWSMNVAVDAYSVDLFSGTDANDLNAPATREQCILYAFNALTGTDLVSYAPLLDIYTSTGLFKDEKSMTLGEKLYGLGCASTSELSVPNRKGVYTIGNVNVKDDLSGSIGRSVRVWYTSDSRGNAVAISNAYCNDVVLGSNHYGYTYTEMTTPGKSSFICKADPDIVVYVNGSRYDEHGCEYTIAAVGGKKGVEVTFIDTAVNGLYDGVADKVFVLEKQVIQLSKDPSVRTISGTTTVMIEGITTSYMDADTVLGYESVSYGDVVLYWTDGIGNLHIEKADHFIGTLTGTKRLSDGGMGYVISGETYHLSALPGSAALTYCMYDISGAPSAAYREFVYYVDNGGYIVAAIPVAENLSDYVMVDELAVIDPQGVDSAAYLQALLVDMEGNKKVVTVSSVTVNSDDFDGNGIADSSYTYKGNGSQANNLINTSDDFVNPDLFSNSGVIKAVSDLVGNTYWTYTETANGSYVLSSVYTKTINGVVTRTGSLEQTDGALNDIQSDKAHFSKGLTGTTQTVFVLYNKLTNTYDVYRGVANVPNVELVSTEHTAYIEVNGFVQYVFVGKGAIAASSLVSENTAFLLNVRPVSDTFSSATNTGYGVYQAIVNGQLTTIKVKMSWQDVFAEGVGYKTVYYDGSYVIRMEGNAKGLPHESGYVVSDHSLRLNDDAETSYTFGSNAKAYIVDSNRSADITVTSIENLRSDNNDDVFVVIPALNSTTASYIVIYENKPTANVTFTTQPVSAFYNLGEPAAALTAVAQAEDSQSRYLSYQWYVSEDSNFDHAEVIPGANTATLAISTADAGVYYYFCKAIHARAGMESTSDISVPAVITVYDDVSVPVILEITEDLTVAYNATEVPSLNVTVELPAEGTLSYQWYREGEPLEGATSSVLDLTGHLDTGVLGEARFTVEITHSIEGNPNTGKTSADVTVTVVPADSGIQVSEETMALNEDDITFTAALSEAVTGQITLRIDWFGGNGWTEVGTATCDLTNSTEINCMFEAAFNAEGRYKITYTISQAGYNDLTGDYTTELSAPAANA